MTGEIKNTEGALRGRQENSQPMLRVYTFGTFRLAWQVAAATQESAWDSRTSARSLFKLLLCAPGRQAPKSVLAGILWPETDEERARESLRSAYKVLRKVLRTASGEELLELRTTDDTLQLAEQTRLWVDADAFEELVSQASHALAPDRALSLWQEANALQCGGFLADDQHCEWARHKLVKRRRQVLWMARCRMIRHLADFYVQQGQMSLAEETLEAHVVHFPTDQDALYRLLVLLEQQGCFEQASVLYERASRALEGLGKQPAPHVRACYERFRQSIISPPSSTARVSLPTFPVISPGLPQRNQTTLVQEMVHLPKNPLSLPKTMRQLETSLDILHILIDSEKEGEDMSLFSRRQLLELGIAALISHLAQLDSKRVSAVERTTLSRALSESIEGGWKQVFSLENAQVVAIGRAQLSLLHQAHTLVYPSVLPYLYAGAHSLVGIGLHFQERDEEALQEYHHGYIASLATGDSWYVAQSLICQADSYHALGQYSMAIQTIEEALQVIAKLADEDEKLKRSRAHLLSCWADNAMMLRDDRTTQEKLEMAETYLEPSMSNEEFDRAAWLLIAGKYALNLRNYEIAKDCFEEALITIPEPWYLRRVMTATGLAMAHAHMRERESSIFLAKDLVPLIKTTNAPMTNRWFTEYLQQDLLGNFPDDSEIQGFVVDACRQIAQQKNLLESGAQAFL